MTDPSPSKEVLPLAPLSTWLGHAALAAGYGATVEVVLTTVAVPLAVSDVIGLVLFWIGSMAYLAPICLATAVAARWLSRRWGPTSVTLPLSSALLIGVIVALGLHTLRSYVAHQDLQFPDQVAALETALVFAVVVVGLLAHGAFARRLHRHLRPSPRFERRFLGFIFAAAGLLAFYSSYFLLASVHLLRTAMLAGCAGAACSTLAAACLLPPPKGRLGYGLAAALVASWLVVPLRGPSADHALYLRNAHTPLSGGLASTLRDLADFDGDGAAPGLLGGTDCAELDPGRGPGVREVPGDGIDQDCRGGDAASQRQPQWRFELPEQCRVRAEHLSVLLITIDAMRADALNRARTPHLSQLARNALSYSRAYAPSVMTNASMAATLSGRPFADLVDNAARTPAKLPPVPSIVSLLRDAGIETVVFNRLALDPELTRGFVHINPVPLDIRHVYDSRPLHSAAHSQAVLAWLDAEPRRRFIWVHYADAHAPYRVPSLFEDGETGYGAAFRYIDEQLGHLLAGLSERKLLGNHVVVVTSDHGEELGDRLQEGHGPNVFEESIHVPLLVWIPGCQPRVDARPVSLTRLMPSLAGLLDVPFSRPGLWTEQNGSLPVVAEEGTLATRTFKRAILAGDDKLIVDERSGGRVLFDLSEDPGELHNVYAQRPELAERMEAIYQRWLDAPGLR